MGIRWVVETAAERRNLGVFRPAALPPDSCQSGWGTAGGSAVPKCRDLGVGDHFVDRRLDCHIMVVSECTA